MNKYQGLVDSLVKDVLNREDFEYDPKSDAYYAEGKKTLTAKETKVYEELVKSGDRKSVV